MANRFPKSAWRDHLKTFLRARNGTIAITFALLAIPLILGIGISVDFIRAYGVKSRLSAAVDAAALAASTAGGSAQTATTVGANYVAANFTTADGVMLNTPSVDTSVAGKVTVSATASVPTTFSQLFGNPAITVGASSTVQRQPSTPIEVVLVMDNFNSMGSHTLAAKQAAAELVTTLFGEAATNNPNIRVSLIPYMGAINAVPVYIPNGSTTPAAFAQTLTSNTTNPNAPGNYVYSPPTADYSAKSTNDPTLWMGCVEESAAMKNALIQDDHVSMATAETNVAAALATPWTDANGTFSPYYWPAEIALVPNNSQCALTTSPTQTDTGNGNAGQCNAYTPGVSPNTTVTSLPWSWWQETYGPNRACPPPLTPLTNNLAPLLTAIGPSDTTNSPGLGSWPHGGQMASLGMTWAYRVLSPDGPYKTIETVAAFTDAKTKKYVILLSNGCEEWDQQYSSWGLYPWPGDHSHYGQLNTHEQAACDVLRDNGVTIFSVNLSDSPDTPYYYCAGTTRGGPDQDSANLAYYYSAPDDQTLIDAFRAIATKLSNPLITN